MSPQSPTRRDFLSASGALLGGTWLATYGPAIEAAGTYARDAARQQRALEILTPREAADLEAIGALIIPTDDTPGAAEAGVTYFADRALGTFFDTFLDGFRTGMLELVERSQRADAQVAGFAALSTAQQEQILRDVEQENVGFFFAARSLVVMAVFADPSYGGNRNKMGWELLGFDDRSVHQPPFGYYDAEYRRLGQ